MPIPEINIKDAKKHLDEESATFVDIRDPRSFASARIAGATHLDNESFEQFLAEADRERPLIVYCYHGNNSKMATSFLLEKGFQDVFSMAGGFEEWRQSCEFVSD